MFDNVVVEDRVESADVEGELANAGDLVMKLRPVTKGIEELVDDIDGVNLGVEQALDQCRFMPGTASGNEDFRTGLFECRIQLPQFLTKELGAGVTGDFVICLTVLGR